MITLVEVCETCMNLVDSLEYDAELGVCIDCADLVADDLPANRQ